MYVAIVLYGYLSSCSKKYILLAMHKPWNVCIICWCYNVLWTIMMHNGNIGGNGQNITAGTNTTAAATLPLITARANIDRVRWHLHHRQMVRRSGVDGLGITARWLAGPALMLLSSQPDGTPDWCR
jgi:hypothetical protein